MGKPDKLAELLPRLDMAGTPGILWAHQRHVNNPHELFQCPS